MPKQHGGYDFEELAAFGFVIDKDMYSFCMWDREGHEEIKRLTRSLASCEWADEPASIVRIVFDPEPWSDTFILYLRVTKLEKIYRTRERDDLRPAECVYLAWYFEALADKQCYDPESLPPAVRCYLDDDTGEGNGVMQFIRGEPPR